MADLRRSRIAVLTSRLAAGCRLTGAFVTIGECEQSGEERRGPHFRTVLLLRLGMFTNS